MIDTCVLKSFGIVKLSFVFVSLQLHLMSLLKHPSSSKKPEVAIHLILLTGLSLSARSQPKQLHCSYWPVFACLLSSHLTINFDKKLMK